MATFNETDIIHRVEIKDILIDAIKLGDQDLVRSFETEIFNHTVDYLVTCLQVPSSPAMLELLLSICSLPRAKAESTNITIAAVRLSTPIYSKLLLKHGLFERENWGLFYSAASTRSPEMFRFLTTIQPRIEEESSKYFPNSFFGRIIPEKPDVTAEAATLECLEIIKDRLDKSCFNCCLANLAIRCQAKFIAMFCLENGADADAYISYSKAKTSLWCASKFDRREAAEFMKLLLTHGANPLMTLGGTHISKRPGPRNIPKWFGMEWDDFVHDCQRGIRS